MYPFKGFSKLTKLEKIRLLSKEVLGLVSRPEELLKSFWISDAATQKVVDEFSENTISNFISPYGVVPNVLMNDKFYTVPMVIEESSVVAAASKACKFWMERGGFSAEIISTTKNGQVHLDWRGESQKIKSFFETIKSDLISDVSSITASMEKRGGGLLSIRLIDKTEIEEGYFQLWAEFETCDAMGANFINSVLEALGQSFKDRVASNTDFVGAERELMVIMAILSNYTPDCLVRVSVSSPVEKLDDPSLEMSPELFAEKFVKAVRIATIDVNRATTHNKGIYNGIDAVVLATGNDFRAIEACGHAYAARDGQYRSLSSAEVVDGIFSFTLEVPLALGTVGGLTGLHPLAKLSLDMLERPTASGLMKIVATIGLAQNFAAVRSLVTSGIQKGHMKMHLLNILNHLEANECEIIEAKDYFAGRAISYSDVKSYLSTMRGY